MQADLPDSDLHLICTATGEGPSTEKHKGWLLWLCASRAVVSVGFMMYAGALPLLLQAWSMSAAQAGFVQTGFNTGYALSLVVTGWLSDRLGAKRLFLWSSIGTAVVGILVAVFARSFETGLVLFTLLGLSQGGTYTPAIMLVAQGVDANRRGFAIGLLLAGASFGYAASIAISTAVSQLGSYQAAFLICGAAPTLAAVCAWLGSRSRPNLIPRKMPPAPILPVVSHRRSSTLLTLGYTAHCWELLGMWAWMPAFLLSSIAMSSATSGLGVLAQGIWIGVVVHLSGCVAAFSMGHASDRFGRRTVLISLASLGALCSMSIGWLGDLPSVLLLMIAALYGFAVIGDSPVLSTAITETVAPASLGSALALRSILGFGAGGMAPLAFGAVRDATTPGLEWVMAFSCLGIGGLLAAVFAFLLPRITLSAGVSRPPQ